MTEKYFVGNIEALTLRNTNFRRVLFTGPHSQLVLMRLRPGEEIGEEVHYVDQFFRFERGDGIVNISGMQHRVSDGSAVVIPSGRRHNIINVSKRRDLKLYTIYSPPHHPDGMVVRTKKEAMTRERN